MKILHVEDFFHPDAGYQINILPRYLQSFGHENVIVTSLMDRIPAYLTDFFGRDNLPERDREYTKQTGVRLIRLPIRGYVSGRSIFTRQLYRTILDEKPDVLYLHGNDTLSAMAMLLRVKQMHCAVILDSHMLAMASVNRFGSLFHFVYRHTFTRLIMKYQLQVIRTQDDNYVEQYLGIPLQQAPWISYGSDTMLFHPNSEKRSRFREENHVEQDAFVVVYCGKLDESKGGVLLAEALKEPFDTEKKVVFVVVGNTSGDYGERVETLFAASKNRILRFPTQPYNRLPDYFQAADLAVFPKQCSLSFYDAQACSLPVLCENNSVSAERCRHHNGFLFQQNSVSDFREKLTVVFNMDSNVFREYSDNALRYITEQFDYEQKAREYEAVIMQTLQRYRGEGK